jgi:hypothetical protein
VATNFAPFIDADGLPDRAKAKPLTQAGWRCLTEVYTPEQPGITPEKRHAYAQHYTYDAIKDLPADHRDHGLFEPGEGWYETQPIIGLYRGFTMSDYPTVRNYRNWSGWSSESVL